MTIKRVEIGFRMSDVVIQELYATHPTILKADERGPTHTVLIVDVTPAQEASIVPQLRDRLIRVEDVPGGVWPPAPGSGS